MKMSIEHCKMLEVNAQPYPIGYSDWPGWVARRSRCFTPVAGTRVSLAVKA